MYKLKEKYGDWALVTGASSGIGEEFANVLASEKINLVLAARRIEKLNSLAAKLGIEHGIKVITIQVDLTDENFLDKIINGITGLEIGILINNAGAGHFISFENSDIDIVSEVVKLNCLAPVVLAEYFVKKMAEQKRGAVIFVGSIAGIIPNPGMAVYAATKAFNNVAGSALWYDQKKNNIDILSVAPGGTRTEFHHKALVKPGPFNTSPLHVVHTSLKALGKKPFVVDGFVNKAAYILSRLVPVKFIIYLSGRFSEKRKKAG